MQTITLAADAGQWQAAAWRLERKFRDRWGRCNRRAVGFSKMSDDELRSFIERTVGISR